VGVGDRVKMGMFVAVLVFVLRGVGGACVGVSVGVRVGGTGTYNAWPA